MSTTALQRIGFSDFSQHLGAGLHSALLGLAVYRYQPELGNVAVDPLEVVEQRPVNVATNIDPVIDATFQSRQGPLNVLNPARIVLGANAIFGNHDGHSGLLARIANRMFQGFGIKLV